MRTFRQLQVWEKAHRFTILVYKATQDFPTSESIGLTRQIRRAAASIPTNIAEGCGRRGNPEFAHFLEISLGSANEADYQLLLARDLGYLKEDLYQQLSEDATEIQKMLVSFIQKIRPTRSARAN
jgi:four helix bundle protein